MREEEFMFVVLLVVATFVVPWLIFALASLFAGFPRLRLNQVLGLVGVSAWVFASLNRNGPYGNELLVSLTVFGCSMGFAGMWNHEFRLLMLRRPDEFPGPQDRLVWTFVLTVMAPAGVWLFRSYRKARWPEAVEAARPHPLDDPEPASDVQERAEVFVG